MYYLRYLLFSILFLSILIMPYSQEDTTEPVIKGTVEGDILPDIPNEYRNIVRVWDVTKLDLPWILEDTNNDSKYDIAFLVYEDTFNTHQELIDVNYDGYVDEIAYYNEDGNIVYQEFDTNYDREIDYWAEIYNGERVLRIQRDLDYDGFVDRDYNFKKQLALNNQ